ncbi:MAG: hypothetical protein HZB21_02020 [Deltaproteobacteria bacterium]|nr:hypothetical protein [Deltaproteobacteria bacterium]
MKRISVILLTGAVLMGCSGVIVRTEGQRIDRETVLSIKPGATSRQAVLNAFGTPAEITNDNGEEKMIYTFKERKTPAYIGGMVEDEARSKTSTTNLEFTLKNDIVYSYRFKTVEN